MANPYLFGRDFRPGAGYKRKTKKDIIVPLT